MTSRHFLTPVLALLPIVFTVGCASSSSKTTGVTPTPTSAPVWTETTGTETTSDHTAIQSYNNQIVNAEHAMDPGAPAVANPQNQGIP